MSLEYVKRHKKYRLYELICVALLWNELGSVFLSL